MTYMLEKKEKKGDIRTGLMGSGERLASFTRLRVTILNGKASNVSIGKYQRK